MTRRSALARPKINLYLHVLGQRRDGYHMLESLAVFAETGDRVSAEPATSLSLSVSGTFGAELEAGEDNLVMQAAMTLQNWARATDQDAPGAALRLDKRLPIASGIGGGSADAAAALNVLRELWALDISDGAMAEIALTLGADVPVCLESRSRVMRGIGEDLSDPPLLPDAWLVLTNPMRQVSTAAVFSELDLAAPPPGLVLPSEFENVAALGMWLAGETTNDLEKPARRIVPEIDEVISALSGCEGSHLARMSGSGATCFAVFDDEQQALTARDAVRSEHSDWWVEAAALSR